MSFWSRALNVFRPGRLNREIDEELRSHFEEAIASGRDPAEVRRSFGPPVAHRERSRDARLLAPLDSLRADFIFGCRQLRKRPITSLAAILSLALAIGCSASVFRLMDALLLRPLPVAHADRLYAMVLRGIGPNGDQRDSDSNEHPQFLLMRNAVKDDAELIATSWTDRTDLTFSSDAEMEKAYRQFVSGWMFNAFGLKPALGRLLTAGDDHNFKASPYAVISYDYWSRRFGRDPGVLGHTFRTGNDVYQIVGVAPEGFTGTEPGTFSDIFLPNTMYEGAPHDDWSWIRTFVLMKPGGNRERVRQRLQAIWTAVQTERSKSFHDWPPDRLAHYLQQRVVIVPASSGQSYLQQTYRVALIAVACIVAMVLLIACLNVANLLTAQAAARSREMSLRVSIGAGKWRLCQLMLIESALLSLVATFGGALFAWWSAPFIVTRINPPDNPARLALPADWRVLAFIAALAILSTLLFGVMPAFRASRVDPAASLKGGDNPHSRRRLMYALIAVQVAFCFLVHFAADAFVSTLNRITKQGTGFSAERLLVLSAEAQRPQPTEYWYQAAARLKEIPSVENAAICSWPLLSGNGMNSFISVNGAPPGPTLAYLLNVSPGWLDVMKIPLLSGRDFRPEDVTPGVAIINRAFAREYFHSQDPVGKSFDRGTEPYQVIGLVADARYRNMREPITPTAYIPLRLPAPEFLKGASFMVRTHSQNPNAISSVLRGELQRYRSELRVTNVTTQKQIDDAQTVQERLLAALGVFFAGVALLLAAIGLFGVLDYSVLQRRRELGIRIAIGATASEIARQVASGLFLTVLTGAISGALVGLLLEPRIKTLLYQIDRSDIAVLTTPFCVITAITLLTAIPAVIRGIRIDPAEMLRSE
jgi:predicted permease